MTNLTPIIGAEIHVELGTRSKMFCACVNDPFGAKAPNIYTCPVCLGLPGALPVPNKTAIDWTIMIGLALNCDISESSKFDRKHYFYPDLPKGYQISQYDEPFCTNGYVETSKGNVRITRVHLEEDTAKMKHATISGEKVSLIDFNRSGVPLVEIVTEPDIKSSTHAKEFLKKIRSVIRALKVSDADMEKGTMRLEANVSVSTDDSLPDYKIEVKNINSFRFFAKSVDFEVDRLTKLIMRGEKPKQETRGWRSNDEATVSQRTKEDAQDYRYFPEPDIPALTITRDQVTAIRSSLPHLPTKIADELISLGIREDYANLLATNSLAVASIMRAVEIFDDSEIRDKVTVGEYASYLVNSKPSLTTKNMEELPKIFAEETKKKTKETITNKSTLALVIEKVINDHPSVVSDFKAGKEQALGFLMGQVMKETKGKADPRLASQLLRESVS